MVQVRLIALVGAARKFSMHDAQHTVPHMNGESRVKGGPFSRVARACVRGTQPPKSNPGLSRAAA